MDRSPFVSKLVMPRVEESAPKGFSPAEVAKLTSLPGDFGWTWRFLIETGLRWGEATRAQGGSLAALQEVLGHRDLKTTQVYARVTDDLVRREAARVFAQRTRSPGATSGAEKEHQEGA